MEGAHLVAANLKGAILVGAELRGADLSAAKLERADLPGAHLEGADLREAKLKGADLSAAKLEGAYLIGTYLEGADLTRAHLKGADLRRAHLEGANLTSAQLIKVNLQGATLDVKTQIAHTFFDYTMQVADVVWNGAPLIQVDWSFVPLLEDETTAVKPQEDDGEKKSKYQRVEEFQKAARAYRQLAIALRNQGIPETADRFTYRALIMQRKALWWEIRSTPLLAMPQEPEAKGQGQLSTRPGPLNRVVQQCLNWLTGVLFIGQLLGSYLFSWFLALLTGYGFRMFRIVVAYLLLICGFATAYWSVGVNHPRDISFWTALIVSVTAFHLSEVKCENGIKIRTNGVEVISS